MIMLNLVTLKCIQVYIDAKYFHKKWQHRRSVSWGMSQSVIALLGFVFEHEPCIVFSRYFISNNNDVRIKLAILITYKPSIDHLQNITIKFNNKWKKNRKLF